ncbi:hypothetical protein DDE82_000266 [Stemphylium lycopersici]|uniref:CHRD domain-containing protein n=1 Tax=Stemphylium lycopersici TaxID=183478 RepID=A0A364MXD6_STELY|nr:hypothetical protein TW65_08694 [Stemphylium lycopersici]RAR06406.1 hypothetical protein DDE83_006955 [Stemphylium lycopersici]RAR11928.1 hypothetical protein DDE82_000266 [Stemphylium lycopersici]
MLFTTPALLALISAPLAFAAPSPKPSYKSDCKKDFDKKWNSHDNSWMKNEKLFYFDAEYVVKATPDQVIATTGEPAPGQPGARGLFKYGINVAENTICYNITLSGVTGQYQSAAITATHIHEAVKGKAGPPRLAFPNPTGPDERRTSYGCLKGPFFVNVTNAATGKDQADGFHVSQIVANPKGFFTDTHTSQFLSGAVRGQLPGY